MLDQFKNLVRQAFAVPSRSQRRSTSTWEAAYLSEELEQRTMLSVTIGQLIVNDMPNTKDELIAVPTTNTTSNPLTFTAQSSNSNVTATVVSGGRSLVLNVSGVDSNNQAFTGNITFRLFEDAAPATTARIIQLANSGFYNGLSFHRVIQDFVAQGGDPTATGSGGSGTTINDEFNTGLTFTSNGLLAMANSGDDTNDSQFFITDVDLPLAQLPQHLNFQHTIFGIVTSGQDILRKLMSTATDSNDKPLSTARINTATVFTDTQNAVVRLHSAAGFTGSTTITVTANDGQGSLNTKQAVVNVVADTVNDRAILGSVSNQVTKQGTPVTFNVQGIDMEKDSLTFVVKDAASFNTSTSTGSAPANVNVSIQVTPASGNTPASAAITLTPIGTFTGTVNLIIGVRDQTLRSGTSLDQKGNFDTQAITLTVNVVNHAPNTPGGSLNTQPGQAVNGQLTADDGDADKTQVLTYEIVGQPSHGTISNFNSATGAFLYTPAAGYAGSDSFTYRVKDDGGTANGGADTSATTTFTLNVGAPAPTGLALAPASDDGLFNDDRVFSGSNPKFTVSAQAGSIVKFLVNGVTQVTATETSPGQFSATLNRQMLRVGTNSITATATVGNSPSTPSTALGFTYAPSYENVYTVAGDVGSSQQLTFQFTSRNGAYNNEIGVFTVDNMDGSIGGIAPGAAGYAAAALGSSSRQVLFSTGSNAGGTKTLNVTGGQLLVFYIISNNSTDSFIKFNPDNRMTGLNAFFTVDSANPDNIDHAKVTADPQTGRVLMHWEDMLRGGDRDYNDVAIAITPGGTASSSIGEALRVPGGPNHNVKVNFTLQPTKNSSGASDGPPPSHAEGEIGVFVVSDPSGTINGLLPGSAGYLQAALSSSTRQVLFSNGDSLGTQKSIQVPGGSLIAWYYIPGGTAASLLTSNPSNDPGKSSIAFFSFDAANPDKAEHFRWFGPEGVENTDTSGLQLHILDTLYASPSDFDDLMLSITMSA